MEVYQEIYNQLGGNRFRVMTGAKNLTGNKNTLSFKLMKAKNSINFIRITLNSMDLYDIEFNYLSSRGLKLIERLEDIYNDQLREIIEDRTGLRLSL